MNNNIYVVLTQNYTFLARIINFFTKDKYSHISISFDEGCTNMYSIGRKYRYCPFIGVYKKESIYKGVFNNLNSEILIYELNVDKEKYENIISLLDEYGTSSKGYNFIGLVLALFNKKVDRKKYYCSEFIYKVLSDDKVKLYPKTNDIVKPMDFIKIKGLNKIYEGKISNYKIKNIKLLVSNKEVSM